MVENKQHAPAQMKREKEKNKITWILITAEAEIITREKHKHASFLWLLNVTEAANRLCLCRVDYK